MRNKDRLIAGRYAGQARAPIDHARDHRKKRMPPGDTQIEAAPSAACERRGDQPAGIVRQSRIRVQEQERIAGAERRAGVHRRTAPVCRGNDAVGQRSRQLGRAVAGAAIDDDHLGAAGTQGRKRLQRANDDRRLVEHGNDNGKPRHDARLKKPCVRSSLLAQGLGEKHRV